MSRMKQTAFGRNPGVSNGTSRGVDTCEKLGLPDEIGSSNGNDKTEQAMSDEDSLLNSLAKLIPGYGAYREQESRRADDRATRAFLVQRLDHCKAHLDSTGERALADGDFEKPVVLENLRSDLDHARQRLASAVEGYAGWFGDRTVDADLLHQIGTLDANLVSLVDQMDNLAARLDESWDTHVSELRTAIARLHARIDRRNEILTNGS